jgi:DNA-binding NarL/FixJ family response regulator
MPLRIVVVDDHAVVRRGVRALLESQPARTEVLVLTMHQSEELARSVLQAGARGFILKSDADESLIAAIHNLRQHKPFLTRKQLPYLRSA